MLPCLYKFIFLNYKVSVFDYFCVICNFYMQVINHSNVSRSKINKLSLTFLIAYFSKTLYINTTDKLVAERSATISFLFNSGLAYTPQGRVLVKVPLKFYKVGLKFGMFAATKKPFNFRPKKKKQKR